MSIKKNPPDFVRTQEQISYFTQLVDSLEADGVAVRPSDVYSLGAFAVNLALLDQCMDSIAEDGMVMKVRGDRGVITKTNPAVAMQKEAQVAIRSYFKEFQMTPNSRGSQLTAPLSGKQDDGFDDV